MPYEAEKIHMDDSGEYPFLLVSQTVPVTCHKCGATMPSPGRIAIKTDGEARYYCDCITEEEMQEIVQEWALYVEMVQTPEDTKN